MTENNSRNICVICGKEYTGHGNDAYPITDGCCCDECNRLIIIPARIHMYEDFSNGK